MLYFPPETFSNFYSSRCYRQVPVLPLLSSALNIDILVNLHFPDLVKSDISHFFFLTFITVACVCVFKKF